MIVALTGALLVVSLLFVDLLTKALAHASEVEQARYFLGVVKLDFQRNSGIAWSGLSDNPVAMTVITALTALMIVGIGVLFFTYFKKNTPARIVLAVIEAGAIGNFVDRVYFAFHDGGGWVRDFISVKMILPPYTCNVADIYIVLGAIALVFIILFIGKDAAFPLTKKWREEAKAEEALEAKKANKGESE